MLRTGMIGLLVGVSAFGADPDPALGQGGAAPSAGTAGEPAVREADRGEDPSEGGPGTVVLIRADFGIRYGLDMGTVEVDTDPGNPILAPSTEDGTLYAMGLELVPRGWPVSLELLAERSQHDMPIAQTSIGGAGTLRGWASLFSLSALLRARLPVELGPATPYLSAGGGWERVSTHGLSFCVYTDLRCDEITGTLLDDFTHPILRLGVGVDLPLRRHTLTVELADAAGSFAFPVDQSGPLSAPAGRGHAFGLSFGLRGRLFGTPD